MAKFSIDQLREKTLPITVRYAQTALEVRYYAGERAKELENRLEQSAAKFQRERQEAAERQQQGLPADDNMNIRVGEARYELCEALAIAMSEWNATADLERLLEDVFKNEDRKRELRGDELTDEEADDEEARRSDLRKQYAGQKGDVPLKAEWMDALPLPTTFFVQISEAIGRDMAVGGRGKGKG
jgi:hypothetical protein